MQKFAAGLMTLSLMLGSAASFSAERERIPLNVLYLGRSAQEQRTKAFVDFLSARFRQCTATKRDEFHSDLLKGVDVVLIDWAQDERVTKNYPSPVGSLAEWRTPTVFLGSAGLIMAGPWQVIGGAG